MNSSVVQQSGAKNRGKSVIRTQVKDLVDLFRLYDTIIGFFAGIWLLFATMQLAKSLVFSRVDSSFWLHLLEAIYLFAPWFVFSIGCGMLVARIVAVGAKSPQIFIIHGLMSLLLATTHIAVITVSYWIFWPQLVTRVTLGFVFMEQFLKWFPFELLTYLAVVMLWHWQFRIRHEPISAEIISGEESLVVVTDEATLKISVAEIDWLQADDNYVCIHSNGREIRTRSTLKAMLDKLGNVDFFQTHRSAAVNLSKIYQVNKVRIKLTCGSRVPVSRRKYKALLGRLGEPSAFMPGTE